MGLLHSSCLLLLNFCDKYSSPPGVKGVMAILFGLFSVVGYIVIVSSLGNSSGNGSVLSCFLLFPLPFPFLAF